MRPFKCISSPAMAAYTLNIWLHNNFSECTAEVLSPQKAAEVGLDPQWTVMWEDGPFNWGTHLSLGNSATTGEHMRPIRRSGLSLHKNQWWCAVPHYGFDVQFVEIG